MAEVIDLKKRKDREQKRFKIGAARRAQAVAGSLSCGLCPHRCAHCGLAIKEAHPDHHQAPYPMCGPCVEEYLAYNRREAGNTEPEAYWHTDDWAESWRAWLGFMRANDAFRRSAAFLRLMKEFD